MTDTVQLRPHQDEAVDDIDRLFRLNPTCKAICSVLPTGAGKCHGKDTPIMMFDGTVKMVQDVKVGDLLMGPDSKPRQVLSLARGREMLYEVKPVKGESYVVNESHILSFKKTGLKSKPEYECQKGKGEIVNVPLTDYLGSSKHFKHIHKGWRTGVDFNGEISNQYLPPYLLGLWLGDGTSRNASITTADHEIANYIRQWCLDSGQALRVQEQENNASSIYHITGNRRRHDTTQQDLISNNLIMNKHIPHEYRVSNREHRLQLLAGIFDSDGHLTHGGYDLVFKSELLTNDVVFLARSLGFAAYIKPCVKTCTNTGATGQYFRISVSGDMSLVPTKLERHQPGPRKQKKNVLVTGVSVHPIGEGDYYGFTITGDHLYLLGDFMVTHNTIVKAYLARREVANGGVPWLIAHRDVLLGQISDALCMYQVPHSFMCSEETQRDITNLNMKKFGDHFHNPRSPVMVISVATFMARYKKGMIPESLLKKVTLWLMDETHHLTQGSQWGNLVEALENARGVGVTATPIRGDRKGLGRHAHGYFDALSNTTNMIDLVKAGRLTKMKVYQPTELDTGDLKTTAGGDYNQKKLGEITMKQEKSGGSGTKITGSAIDYYNQYIYGQPAITFAVNIEHGKYIAQKFNEAGIPTQFVSSKSKESVRKQAVADLRSGKLWNLVNVDLFGEGFDAPAVAGIFMLRKTQSYSLYKQQIGRCLRPAEGKEHGYVFDHVGNVALMLEKYGLLTPYHDPEWTLDSYGKAAANSDDGDDLPPMMKCPECEYEGPVNTVYDDDGDVVMLGFTQEDGTYRCPDVDFCGHCFSDEEVDTAVQKIQEKKGQLVEMDFDSIAGLIEKRDNEIFKDVKGVEVYPGNVGRAILNKHVDRQNAITTLQYKINEWCNSIRRETGWDHKTVRREFEVTFGVNIYAAQVLSAPKATKLAEEIQNNKSSRSLKALRKTG